MHRWPKATRPPRRRKGHNDLPTQRTHRHLLLPWWVVAESYREITGPASWKRNAHFTAGVRDDHTSIDHGPLPRWWA